MKLKRVYMRHFPPGIFLEAEDKTGEMVLLENDLLDLQNNSDIDEHFNTLKIKYPWVTHHSNHIKSLIKRICHKLETSKVTNIKLRRSFKPHKLSTTHIDLSKDGTLFITGSYDRTAKIWNFKNGKCVATLTGHDDVVYDVKFANKFESVAITGSFDSEIRIWKIPDLSIDKDLKGTFPAEIVQCELVLKGHEGPVTSVEDCVTSTGVNSVLSASLDKKAIQWDIEMGESLGTMEGHEDAVISASSSRKSEFLYTASFDGTCKLWDPRNFKQINSIEHDYCQLNKCTLNWVDFLIGTATTSSKAFIWDIRNGHEPLYTVDHDAEVVHVSWDKTGRKLVSTSVDGSCCFIDSLCLKEVARFSSHIGEVTVAEFDPSGNLLYSVGQDGNICINEVETGRLIQVQKSHPTPIFDLKISYYGDEIVTSSEDGICSLWDTHHKNE
ncbi:UNVERIFIED_CONTAM: hypothetical protein RMT77_012529 [Armadillidium vulgare]